MTTTSRSAATPCVSFQLVHEARRFGLEIKATDILRPPDGTETSERRRDEVPSRRLLSKRLAVSRSIHRR